MGVPHVNISPTFPSPSGRKWYKYSQSQGWYDYSSSVVLNGDRTQLRITLVDGSMRDDDGQQNGIIEDPSGLGVAPAGSGSGSSGSNRLIFSFLARYPKFWII